MKIFFVLFLLSLPFVSRAEINLDLTNLTLPEALKIIGESLSEDNPLYNFDFILPRSYKNKDENLGLIVSSLSEDQIPRLIRDIVQLHGLIWVHEEGIIVFRHKYNNERISLLEAIGASERYLNKNIAQIDVTDFQLAEAAVKYERSQTYSGHWWHLKYTRMNPLDGGANTIHLFVYSNSVVEHVLDRRGVVPVRKTMEETINSVRPISY